MTEIRHRPSFGEWILAIVAILVAGLLLMLGSRAFYRAAYPDTFREYVERESARYDLPPALLFAVIRTESGFDPMAQSYVPARGLMQITQETFEWAQFRIQEDRELSYDDLFDSGENIFYGATILRLLLDELETEENVLCAYHAGRGQTLRWLQEPAYSTDGKNLTHIPSNTTRLYVRKVMEAKQAYEVLYYNE